MANTKPVQKRVKSGTMPDLRERRAQVFAQRANGLSLQGIADALGLSKGVVQRDLDWAYKEWGHQPENTKSAIQAEMVEVLRQATSMVLGDARKQLEAGVTVTTTDHRGEVITSVTKHQVDPRTIAELGRCCERIGKLMGITDGGIDAGGAPQTAIQVNLPGPVTGAEFHSQATGEGTQPPIASSAAISSDGLTST